MRKQWIPLFLLIAGFVNGQVVLTPTEKSYRFTTDTLRSIKPNPYLGVAYTVGTNLTIWGFNKYVRKADFAQISLQTMKRNLQTVPEWDNDLFSTNLLGHPYHGSLYFNAARSHGLNFWQSSAFPLGGSLMWEFFMETEKPSINDLYSTSIGGVMLGEITYRLSDLIIDDRTQGWGRFGRELGLFFVAPTRGLSRIISGDAWRNRSYKGRSVPSHPVLLCVGTGYRNMIQDHNKDSENCAILDFRFLYGDPFEGEDESPYDWFQVKASLNAFDHQPAIGSVSAIGSIWDHRIHNSAKGTLIAGVFQHFYYLDSEPTRKEEGLIPYRVAETASIGGGMLFRSQAKPNGTRFGGEIYLNGVLLGGSYTDYYRESEGRDYNMGSGYSAKINAELLFLKKWHLMIESNHLHLFTWKGINPNLPPLPESSNNYWNVQGDVGHSILTMVNTTLCYTFAGRVTLSASHGYYFRNAFYKYYPTIYYRTIDSRLSLSIRI